MSFEDFIEKLEKSIMPIANQAFSNLKYGIKNFPNFMTLLLFIFVVFLIFTGNGKDSLLYLMGIALIHLFKGIWDVVKEPENKENKINLNLVFAGAGIFIFSITTYLASVPVFHFDGSESCENYIPEINYSEGFFSVKIDDLNARHVGNRPAAIKIQTKVVPEKYLLECTDCNPQINIKPDNNENPKERLVQKSSASLKFQLAVKEFSFIQQVSFSDALVGLISSSTKYIRTCDCKVDLSKETLVCENGSISRPLPFFRLIYDTLFPVYLKTVGDETELIYWLGTYGFNTS